MKNISNEKVYEYASFSDRASAIIIDTIILIPLSFIVLYFMNSSKNIELYEIIPMTLFHIWYWIYLVKRYGGTPGKLIMKIKITKLDFSDVGYKEAILRDIVLLIFDVLSSLGRIVALLHISNEAYMAMTEIERIDYQTNNIPEWANMVDSFSDVWIFSELIVMLTNKKRRSLHDFMAGTVVIKTDVKKKIEQESEYIHEENENNFKFSFFDFRKSVWEEIKLELKDFYSMHGFTKVVIDKENSWMLKSDSQKNAYINLSKKDNIITIETYNCIKPNANIIDKYLK